MEVGRAIRRFVEEGAVRLKELVGHHGRLDDADLVLLAHCAPRDVPQRLIFQLLNPVQNCLLARF